MSRKRVDKISQVDHTVVLLRPDYIATVFGIDVYVAHVTVQDSINSWALAVAAAQKEVFEADTTDGLEPEAPEDYKLCVMFEGHQNPKLFGEMF